jgi:hypothetical protein
MTDRELTIIEVRLRRRGGWALGTLVDHFGADVVVEALSVIGVASILGLDNYENDDEDQS